ncbi:MAG: CBS domain containing protein [Candidatus Methanohalarchaeum thermophilum]|uniref:CBS domain containing protein n=1 Tax=Methanohalarchaeum thermophilum TaxID=1903181 RepID=A0A1Q6DV14_METT1|nr:MAG: CBS domain containing protein [Candidatus Methanohalarchaeum thermophilum]
MELMDIVSAPVKVVEKSEPLSHARNVMLRNNISRVVVTENEEPVGILTKTDMTRGLQQDEPKWKRRPIDKIPVKRQMSKDLITIDSSADISEVACKMINHSISGIPVMEDGNTNVTEKNKIIGIVTKQDLTEFYSKTNLNKRIEEIYSNEVISVHRHHSLNKAVELMKKNQINRIIVIDGKNSPVGIITNSDLTFANFNEVKKGIKGKELELPRKTKKAGEKKHRSVDKNMFVAEDVMSAPLITIDIENKTKEAAKKMVEEEISGIPITKNNELDGIITKTDIVEDICNEKL